MLGNSFMKFTVSIFALVLALSASAATVDDLRCEYRESPAGIDAARPRLSWVLSATERNVKQTAWQVLIASTPERLAKDQGDLWDSGKIESDRSIQNEYAGKALESRARCYWKVRVWTGGNEPSPWSAPSAWSMGLLKPEDWQAKWIGFDDAGKQTDDAKLDDALFALQGLKWTRVPEKLMYGQPACARASTCRQTARYAAQFWPSMPSTNARRQSMAQILATQFTGIAPPSSILPRDCTPGQICLH
jgi:hypothetical protein